MASPSRNPAGTIEVDMKMYLGGLLAIMACSFYAGLTSPVMLLEDSIVSKLDAMSSPAVDPAMPPTVDRAKIVRDSFLLSEEEQKEIDSLVDQENPQEVVSFDPTAAAAGEHLLVDIEGIEADFLDSESRLSQAMINTAKEAGLEMLSYHCHSLEPKGVSCVGVLLESHMSFHTWPDEGVITLDLYVTTVSTNKEQQAKQKQLVPEVVEIIKKEFGIEGDKSAPRPLNTRWSHEFRGFDPSAALENDGIHLAGSDLALYALSPLEVHKKILIYSGWVQSNQRVDIWDLTDVTDTPSRDDILKHGLKDGDPRLFTPELATPDRYIFLNGHLFEEARYEYVLSEASVHPAMFAHRGPKHVTIMSGPVSLGSGAIREVLKHKSVESINVWHPNSKLVEEIVPLHLPLLDNCTALIGRNDQCHKDSLVSMKYYGEEPFSSIMIDENFATPQDAIFVLDFESMMKTSPDLSSTLQTLLNGLTDDGVLLFPVGVAAGIHDPRPDLGIYARREQLFLALEALPDVAALLVYEESHVSKMEPESFLLVCKDVSCRKRWYARSDQVEYEIYERTISKIQPPKGREEDAPVLRYYDGVTQRSYHWPKKGWEAVYCLREPTPWECDYLHLNQNAEFHELDLEDESKSSFRIETVMNNGVETTKVFAKTKIPKGSYIMAEHLANSMMVTDRNLEGLKKNTELAESSGSRAHIIEELLDFFDEHSHPSLLEGTEQHYVEIGGSVLIRKSPNAAEGNLEPWVPRRKTSKPKYSPVYERHRMSMDVFMIASRDIAEGEEIVMYEKMWTEATVE